MREESVARRYAAALFLQSERTGSLDASYKDLQLVGQTLQQTPKLGTILSQPLISEQKKKDALKLAFGKNVSAPTIGFLSLLVDKRRIDILSDVIDEFVAQVREKRNIQAATATSAVPLTTVQKSQLIKNLEERTGKKIELTSEVDPSVLGGVRVRIGDTVLDGTVRGNMDRLREKLLARN